MTSGQVWRSLMTPPDKILLFSLLLISLFSYIFINSLFPSEKMFTAVVEVAGRERGRFSLDSGLPSRMIPVSLREGDEALFEVSGGKIRLLPMPDRLCSKHICSKKGWIGMPWEMIVCLPNRIVVRILGEKKMGDPDLITR